MKALTYPTEFEFTEGEDKKAAMLNFEMRQHGTVLEIDPTWTPNGKINLNLAFEHHLSDPVTRRYSTSLLKPAGDAASVPVEMPIFYKSSSMQALIVPDGEMRLAAATRPLEPRDGVAECHLLFVSAKTTFDKPAPLKLDSEAIGLHLVVFEVDQREAHRLTLRRTDGGGLEEVSSYEHILDLTRDGDAAIIAHNFIRTPSGQRAKVEVSRENIYPTEFDLVEPNRVLPTSFEMRPSGNIFEIDPTLSPDGELLEINMAQEIVGPMRMRSQRFVLLDSQSVGKAEQPSFVSAMVQAAFPMRAKGGVAMIASTPSKANPHKQQLWFLRSSLPTPNRNSTIERQGVECAVTAIAIPAAEAAALCLTRASSDADFYEELVVERGGGHDGSGVAHGSVLTQSSNRAKVTSGEEIIAPAEFEFFGEDGSLAGPTAFEMRQDGSRWKSSPPSPPMVTRPPPPSTSSSCSRPPASGPRKSTPAIRRSVSTPVSITP